MKISGKQASIKKWSETYQYTANEKSCVSRNKHTKNNNFQKELEKKGLARNQAKTQSHHCALCFCKGKVVHDENKKTNLSVCFKERKQELPEKKKGFSNQAFVILYTRVETFVAIL